jgi:hypothetical protein
LGVIDSYSLQGYSYDSLFFYISRFAEISGLSRQAVAETVKPPILHPNSCPPFTCLDFKIVVAIRGRN